MIEKGFTQRRIVPSVRGRKGRKGEERGKRSLFFTRMSMYFTRMSL